MYICHSRFFFDLYFADFIKEKRTKMAAEIRVRNLVSHKHI